MREIRLSTSVHRLYINNKVIDIRACLFWYGNVSFGEAGRYWIRAPELGKGIAYGHLLYVVSWDKGVDYVYRTLYDSTLRTVLKPAYPRMHAEMTRKLFTENVFFG